MTFAEKLGLFHLKQVTYYVIHATSLTSLTFPPPLHILWTSYVGLSLLFSELPAPESSEPVDIESVSPRDRVDDDDEVTSRSVPDAELGAGFKEPLRREEGCLWQICLQITKIRPH